MNSRAILSKEGNENEKWEPPPSARAVSVSFLFFEGGGEEWMSLLWKEKSFPESLLFLRFFSGGVASDFVALHSPSCFSSQWNFNCAKEFFAPFTGDCLIGPHNLSALSYSASVEGGGGLVRCRLWWSWTATFLLASFFLYGPYTLLLLRKFFFLFTVLSRYVESLFGPTRKSSPWGRFFLQWMKPINQSIKRTLSLWTCRLIDWLAASVHFHRELSLDWLIDFARVDWFIGFVPFDLFLRGQS